MKIMAKSKGKPPEDNDRHKPRDLVGIPKALGKVLRDYGESEFMTLTDVVRLACVEFAKSRGLWPLKEKPAP